MFLQRELRTRLDLVRPSTENEVLTHQAYQVQGKDRHACVREFQEGEKVMVKNYRSGKSWLPGRVLQRTGPLSYRVEVHEHVNWRRHADQLRKLGQQANLTSCLPIEDSSWIEPVLIPTNVLGDEHTHDSRMPETSSMERHYPLRIRHPPDYYGQRT